MGGRLEEAEGRGYLVLCKRASRLEDGWRERCAASGQPFLRVSSGGRFASLTLDLRPADRVLSGMGEEEIGRAFRSGAGARSVLFCGPRTVGVVRFPAARALGLAEEFLRIASRFYDEAGIAEEALPGAVPGAGRLLAGRAS